MASQVCGRLGRLVDIASLTFLATIHLYKITPVTPIIPQAISNQGLEEIWLGFGRFGKGFTADGVLTLFVVSLAEGFVVFLGGWRLEVGGWRLKVEVLGSALVGFFAEAFSAGCGLFEG